jgi:hypothetical protein
MRWPVVALAVGILGAGCSVAGDPTATPTPSVQDCGGEQQQMGTGLNVDGRECLLAAFEEGRPVQFVSRQTTIEGDPIGTVS